MRGELRIGAVLHHHNFKFENGMIRNKYLVVLGAKPECDYLCALATTQQWKMKADRGCHHTPRTHFFIPGDGKNFFSKDTWIVLSEPRIMSRGEVIQKGWQKILQVEGNLKDNIAGEIRNCLKSSKDISQQEMQLL